MGEAGSMGADRGASRAVFAGERGDGEARRGAAVCLERLETSCWAAPGLPWGYVYYRPPLLSLLSTQVQLVLKFCLGPSQLST
jgi:hypothetical protein